MPEACNGVSPPVTVQNPTNPSPTLRSPSRGGRGIQGEGEPFRILNLRMALLRSPGEPAAQNLILMRPIQISRHMTKSATRVKRRRTIFSKKKWPHHANPYPASGSRLARGGRNVDGECGAFAGPALDADCATVVQNDAPGDDESQSVAGCFGGEKRFEQPV